MKLKNLIKLKKQEYETPCPVGENCTSCAYVDGWNECIDAICEIDLPEPKTELVPLDKKEVKRIIYETGEVTETWSNECADRICKIFGTKEVQKGLEPLEVCKYALWKITTDYHEDNPDRHINPISAWEVAQEALIKIGAMKNE